MVFYAFLTGLVSLDHLTMKFRNFHTFFIFLLQTGGYTTANYIWDLMQARKVTPYLPAVEAYYNGLNVSLLPRVFIPYYNKS